MNICDIAKAVSPNAEHLLIGIRPGEKIHEQMIGIEDAPYTYGYPGNFKILPMLHNFYKDPIRIKDGQLVNEDFYYASDTNSEWMTIDTLQQWISEFQHQKIPYDN